MMRLTFWAQHTATRCNALQHTYLITNDDEPNVLSAFDSLNCFCVRMCHVCMYVCMFVCMYVRKYVYMVKKKESPIFLDVWFALLLLRMYVRMYVCMYVSMHVSMYVCTYTCKYVYIYVGTYVCKYI